MIEFQNVRKSYGTQDVLQDVTFRVNPGEHVGIVGTNGSGKSTIFALVTGAVTPDKGEVVVPKRTKLGHLRQHIPSRAAGETLLHYAENAVPRVLELEAEIDRVEHSLAAGSNGQQGLLERLGEMQHEFEHLGGYDLRHRAESALSGLGFDESDFSRPLGEFSGGWQMRAELARVLTGRPDILLLDEPTNFLDVLAVEWLQDFLRTFEGTLLLIAHDRFLLNALTRVTIEVAAGRVSRYPGNYDHYLETRTQRHEQLVATRRNQEKRKQDIERFVERFRSQATKATQVQSRIKQLEKMELVEVDPIHTDAPVIRLPKPERSGAQVVALERAGFRYDAGRWLFRNLDFQIERGQRMAIVGYNGMGKTTLLKVLAGVFPAVEGTRRLGSRVTTGYMPQEPREVLAPQATVWQTVRSAAGPEFSDGKVRGLLGSFRFPGDSVDKPADVLSGGERMRLALARLLVNPPNFLILDEPTTHLDIVTRQALERALSAFEGTVCLVSHDIEFVRKLATRVCEITREEVRIYHGGYEYYRQKKAELSEQAKPAARAPKPARTNAPARPNAPEAPSPKDQTAVRPQSGQRNRDKDSRRREAERRQYLARKRKPLQNRLNKAEARVLALEEERDELWARLAAGAGDHENDSRRLAELKSELETANAEWEAAAWALEQYE